MFLPFSVNDDSGRLSRLCTVEYDFYNFSPFPRNLYRDLMFTECCFVVLLLVGISQIEISKVEKGLDLGKFMGAKSEVDS